jgi:hypothetical protein
VIADAKAAAGGNTLFVPADYGITLLDISWRTDFWWASFTSFVGKFGFISIELPTGYYLACLALFGLALLGGLVRLRTPPRANGNVAVIGTGLAILAGTALFAMFSSAGGEYSPQGRYLFAALVPIAIGLVAGWTWIAGLAPVLRIVPFGATLGLIGLNVVALFAYVVPAYFGSWPDSVGRMVLQVDPPLTTPEVPIQLVGWALEESGGRWLPFLPDGVEHYRKPALEVRAYSGAPPPYGRLISTANYGLLRADVDAFYGSLRRIENVGYRIELPLEALPDRGGGLYVCASGPPVREAACVIQAFSSVRP